VPLLLLSPLLTFRMMLDLNCKIVNYNVMHRVGRLSHRIERIFDVLDERGQ
jgi:environmental stress-induced protein Ves